MTSGTSSDFQAYVRLHLASGEDGFGKPASYIAPSHLEEYWTPKRINDVLYSYPNPAFEMTKFITIKYLRIFSILIYIGQICDIELFRNRNFDDKNLPFSSDDFPEPWQGKEDFIEYQWMFCPLVFPKDGFFRESLRSRLILPVKEKVSLREEGQGPHAAQVQKITLDHELNVLGLKDDTVVFKIYHGSKGKDLYEAESKVYSALSNCSSGITSFYGSFSYGETQKWIIILEYAPGGSLLDFLQSTQPPVFPDEHEMLWDRLLELLDGLHALHNLYRPEGSQSWILTGVHLDIQPANILVFPALGSSRFDVRFKLVDFGNAGMRRMMTEENVISVETEGNRMYSAPESYTNKSVHKEVRQKVHPKVDLWSLGAVYSDVLIWSLGGEDGRERYRQRRKEEIATHTELKGSGYEACFHNGTRRIDAIEEQHNLFLTHKRASDILSPGMSGFIIKYMLTKESLRGESAKWLRYHGDEVLQQIRKGRRVERTMPPRSQTVPARRGPKEDVKPATVIPRKPLAKAIESHPWDHTNLEVLQTASSSEIGSQEILDPRQRYYESPVEEDLASNEKATPGPPEQPVRVQNDVQENVPNNHDLYVSIDMVYEILSRKETAWKRASGFGRSKDRKQEVMALHGMQDAFSKITACGQQRDQIMLIDNFSSMAIHKPQVKKAVRVISYVTKAADEDGVDLYFASDMKRPRNSRNSSGIEAEVSDMRTIDGRCSMRMCLDTILKRVFSGPNMNPTSIYIYTDGVWEQEEGGVETTIRNSIKSLTDNKLPPSTLMFQFIQFGHDPRGSERLRHLDDDCRQTHNGEEYDIVDTKHCNDHVPSIIIGSITKDNDTGAFVPRSRG